ncbi:MAG: HD domain-containing protein [Planctomycetes bacterium]|nr:HD domain-containing protein [Planctomycetota bacterium]MCH9725251.1 HD domain-containing protein [Planctomycetota bacterium]MCH9779529.1 HD domain-containing protein [Planctomycetota bacterium]MCH9791612.1 HD domain-containing protein [Planctomycetota bacterium]
MNAKNPLSSEPSASASRPDSVANRLIAVIDIGTGAIRMEIAEIKEDRSVNTLEKLSQAVTLGEDTFQMRNIQKTTMEECVRILKSYRRRLDEYQITRDNQIRVVATSAVREADNRLVFTDRIFIATGFEIAPLDEAEVNRITYQGIRPYLTAKPNLDEARTIVTEIGGGTTELLLVQHGDVLFSNNYRLGALRLREMLKGYRVPLSKERTIMENQIERVVEQIVHEVPSDKSMKLVVLGGDVRFALSQLRPEDEIPDPTNSPDELDRIKVSELSKFTDKILQKNEDQLVQNYHLSFTDAETLGPALLAYTKLAEAYQLKHIYVTKANFRDGLLKEMADQKNWSDEFNRQVIRSTIDFGKRFDFDETHARHVAFLADTLFQSLQNEHKLELRNRLLLYTGALLHEIGIYVNQRGYHKHSMYLISNGNLFGLGQTDLLLVSLIARYHRRASPKATHPGYATLDRLSRIAITKMAAILRVADALDYSYSQRVKEIECEINQGQLIISIPHVEDVSLEQIALVEKGPLFEEVFGLKVHLRNK